jgi:tetratricopeptide (TPR) repeat protein
MNPEARNPNPDIPLRRDTHSDQFLGLPPSAFSLGFLLAAVLIAYLPAMHGGFLWDDDSHISENAALRSAGGLYDVWFKPGATCQYYPLTFTAFWAGYQLWGLKTFGYHLLTVLMHGIVSVLLWQLLKQLKVRGAWLAAAIFALHPVCVMSVAWMTELKNTLSAALALGAALAYVRYAGGQESLTNLSGADPGEAAASGTPALRFMGSRQSPQSGVHRGLEPGKRRTPNIEHRTSNVTTRCCAAAAFDVRRSAFDVRCFLFRLMGNGRPFAALSLLLFLAAVFAKTAVSFLPATLFLLVWWKRERMTWRRLWPLLTMLAIAAGMGLLTIHVEQRHGTADDEFHLGLLERVLVSGRSFWFYLGKLFFPYPLTFIYERWTIDARVWWQYAFPVATLAVLAGLWLLRNRIGRGLFVAGLHFYITTSMLVLIQVLYMMRYTFVSDHWQYYGCMSIIVVVAAGAVRWLKFETRNSKLEGSPKLETRDGSAPFGIRVSDLFRISSFGFRILSGRLLCSSLLLTLGVLTWRQAGVYSDSETLWRTTLARNPRCWMAHNNLGNDLLDRGEVDQAIVHFQRALAIQTNDAMAHFSLGNALRQKGQWDAAIASFQKGLAIQPVNEEALDILGIALLQQGRVDEAISHFQKALAIVPENAQAHGNLGNALVQRGQNDEAILHLRKALELRPGFAEAHFNLGFVLSRSGWLDDAITHFQKALEFQPGDAATHVHLGMALVKQGRVREAIGHYQTAFNLQPGDADTCRNLAWVLATCPDPAVRDGARAVEMAEKANRQSGGGNLAFLGTLAAAYAETGRFADAVAVGEQALQLATAQNNAPAVEAIQRRVGFYRAGSPFRDTSQTNTAVEVIR